MIKTENYTETVNSVEIKPHGLIPEFNALGNHPKDMVQYIDTHVQEALTRLGMADKFPEAREILIAAAKEIASEDEHFTGHHVPNEKTAPVLDLFLNTFIDAEACGFFGRENFELARQLTAEGNNVLIVQNHISPVDAFVPFAIIKREYGHVPISVVLSQVFEYARVTNLMTTGIDKFPVFQPKHMKRFEKQGEVIDEMCRQNTVTLKSVVSHARQGGKMVFLYPEKNRNNRNMGVAEPAGMAVPELLSKAGRDLYVLPTFITGLDSIFPNSPGRNELDDYFEIIKRGQGDFYCGAPVKYSDIKQIAESLSSEEQMAIAAKVTGEMSTDKKAERKAVISSIILGLIANVSPDESMKGVYADPQIQNLVSQLEVAPQVAEEDPDSLVMAN